MAYYADRVGGYPLGPDLVEDALGGGLGGRGGYGAPSFEYERGGRPLGGEYLGGPPEYIGAERPGLGRGGLGREGYGMEGLGMEGYERGGLGRGGYGMEGLGRERFGREGLGREGFGPSVYDDGYPSRRPMMPPPMDYLDGEPSDLGMGLREAGMRPGYDMRSELGGYGGAPGYAERGFGGSERGFGGGAEEEVRRLRRELEHERRQKHELELATGAPLGYGPYERREKEGSDGDDSDSSDDGEKKEPKHTRLLHKLGL